MTVPSVLLQVASNDDVTREMLFELYCILLREFIEPLYGWDKEFQRKRFDSEYPSEKVQQIYVDAAFAGYTVVHERTESHHIALLLIRPECQRVGIGRAVMKKLTSHARSCGRIVTLSSFTDNRRAIVFYQSLGFAVNGIESNFALLSSPA